MEELLLSDFISLCVKFKKDPTEENNNRISEFVRKIQVATYMPIRKKQIAVALILNCASFTESMAEDRLEDTDITEITINTEAGKTIFGILPYALNLKNDLGNQALNLSIYDLLFQFGINEQSIVDYILEFCNKDFERLEKMVQEASNYSNLYRLSQTVELLTPDNLKKFTETISELKSELTEEKLRAMKDLVSTNDPAWTALKDTIDDNSILKAMSKLQNKKEIKAEEDNK